MNIGRPLLHSRLYDLIDQLYNRRALIIRFRFLVFDFDFIQVDHKLIDGFFHSIILRDRLLNLRANGNDRLNTHVRCHTNFFNRTIV
ncbi:hypothetical protein D3C85_1699380 [compost metagenome]